MTDYLLSNHVHVRQTRDGVILLDLRRDQYLSLNLDQVAALRHRVSGWTEATPSDTDAANSQDPSASRLIVELTRRGILTTSALNGKPVTEAQLQPTEASLCDQRLPLPAQRLRYAAALILACVRTSATLRLRSLGAAIAGVERRKKSATVVNDPARLREAMSVYCWLRPFLYTQKEKCLFDSLTLVNYLASQNLYPQLVFGVRGRPFLAHAWVQDDTCALNYTADYVKTYAPILVI
ncbi:MAG: lasso peptide biosynthesis B2 protein [Steroidobacter sp.]|nr:lasso peptide biosynthesis B2 protein [Steroidobacter sp.]